MNNYNGVYRNNPYSDVTTQLFWFLAVGLTVFVDWYGSGADRYQKHSFIGTVGIWPFRVVIFTQDRAVLKRVHYGNPKTVHGFTYWNVSNCSFTVDLPSTKLKGSVPIINKRTLYLSSTIIRLLFSAWCANSCSATIFLFLIRQQQKAKMSASRLFIG
jgi:hypothetical protein